MILSEAVNGSEQRESAATGTKDKGQEGCSDAGERGCGSRKTNALFFH